MSYNKNDVDLGDIGEKFVLDRADDLITGHLILRTFHFTGQKIEGGDIGCISLEVIEENPSASDISWCDDPDLTGKTEYKVEGRRWCLEVKTMSIEQFLTWNDRLKLEHGSLGFPIWKNKDYEEKGYLYKLMHPKEFNGKAAKPLALIIILTDENNRVFASIAFNPFDALKDCLVKLAGEMDIVDYKGIPVPKQDNPNWTPPAGINVIANMWRVPFDDLADLATVTMVGDDINIADIKNKNHVSDELITKRLDFLKSLANGRHIPQETEHNPSHDKDLSSSLLAETYFERTHAKEEEKTLKLNL